MRAVFALGILVAAPSVAAEGPATGDLPEVRLAPRARADGERPLDWVLDKVPARNDDVEGEKVEEAIGARLAALAAKLVAGGIDAGFVEGLVAPGFRAGDVAPRELETAHASGGLVVSRTGRVVAESGAPWPPDDPALPGRSASDLARGLAALTDGWSRVAKAKFKVFRVEATAAGAARASVLLETDGDLRAGGTAQIRAVWHTRWARAGADADWRLAELRPGPLERATLAERTFVEITPAALGASPAYGEQLLVGLDAWRTRIDSASGIDIYGHQGVSVGDADGDGREDLYIAQPAGLPNRLFRSLGDGAFEDVTERAGVGILDTTGGSLFADLDGDRDQDLVVVTALEVLLLENDGRGRFTRRTGTGIERAGDEGASSMGCAAADHDLDGDLDLYVFAYIFWAGAGSKTHTSYPYPYHDAENGAPNHFFRNDGGWRFTDITAASGLDANNRRFSLAASWCDYDDDGDPDLYVANDFGRNNLYRNDRGRFRDVAAEAGVEDTGNGMSVAWEDYDGDGRIDLYVGNMWSSAGNRLVEQPSFRRTAGGLESVYRRMARGNSLFRNLGGGRFEDVTEASGTAFGRWAWSCAFLDHDSDGREDLFVANGFVTNESPGDL